MLLSFSSLWPKAQNSGYSPIMPSIALQRHDVIVGVDTHKDEHIAVAIGGLIDKPKLAAATPDGYAELLVWAQSLGEIHAFGVEGCGSYGSGLARFLRRHGHIVHEVARPPRKGERRLSGKSDPIDAEHAARTVLSGSGKTSGRHRLNRGGNRQANAALYRVVVVRLRWHPPTIAYVKRRKADGLSKKDIIRSLKRFVARELYHLLPEPSLPLEPTSTPSPT